jgi:ABC-type transporter lipoprotein component MlaA
MTLVEIVQETGDEWLKGFMASQYLNNHQYDEYQLLRDEYVKRREQLAEKTIDSYIQADQQGRSNTSNKTGTG